MAQAADTLKHERMMELILRLQNGEVVRKGELADEFGVNARTIQRDMDDLRSFFANRAARSGVWQELIYDYGVHGYRLHSVCEHKLTDGEALTVCKILLESRSLRRDEMFPILEKIIQGCVPLSNRSQAEKLIANEKFLYIEPRHRKRLVDRLWKIGQAVREQRFLHITYQKLKNKEQVHRRVKPVGIMFSEFYFYMTAFTDHEPNDQRSQTLYPTIYRVDRILDCSMEDEHFQVPYRDRFQEGEFRKRIQFMFGGQLKTVRFRYTGMSVEAVLDRLPTAKILEETDDGYLLEAEVFGDGIDMWFKSQSPWITVLDETTMEVQHNESEES